MNDQSTHEDIQSILRIPKREVWIITAATDSQRGGLVATYVSSGSINPETPTLVIAIAKNHFTRELIDQSNAFAAHLITAQQIDLAWQFAIGSGRDRDKFADVDFSVGKTSSPILSNSLACLECKVIKSVDAGDRIYYWAEVVAGKIFQDAPALVDHELIAAASDEQLQQLFTGMQADIEIQKPMFEAWVGGTDERG